MPTPPLYGGVGFISKNENIMKNLNILLVLAFTLLFSCKSYSQVIETDEDISNNYDNTKENENLPIYHFKNSPNAFTTEIFIDNKIDKILDVSLLTNKMKTKAEFDSYSHKLSKFENVAGLIIFTIQNTKNLMNFEQLMHHFGVDKKYWDYTFYNNCKKLKYPKEIWGKTYFIQKVYINHKTKSIKLKTLDTACDPKPPGTIMIR